MYKKSFLILAVMATVSFSCQGMKNKIFSGMTRGFSSLSSKSNNAFSRFLQLVRSNRELFAKTALEHNLTVGIVKRDYFPLITESATREYVKAKCFGSYCSSDEDNTTMAELKRKGGIDEETGRIKDELLMAVLMADDFLEKREMMDKDRQDEGEHGVVDNVDEVTMGEKDSTNFGAGGRVHFVFQNRGYNGSIEDFRCVDEDEDGEETVGLSEYYFGDFDEMDLEDDDKVIASEDGISENDGYPGCSHGSYYDIKKFILGPGRT